MAFAPSLPPSTSPSDDCYDRDYSDRVEGFVILAVVAMFLLHILGSLRRQSGHGILHGIVMGINTLSYPLVSYTIGWMQATYWYYDDFAVWAVILLMLLGSTDNLTAFRLNDIDNWKSLYVKHIFKGVMVVYVIATYGVSITYLLPPLLAILLVGILKWYVRIASMRMVSKSYLWKNVKVIADYMENEVINGQLQVAYNPLTMAGYPYVVAGEGYCCTKLRGHVAPLYRAPDPDSSKVLTVEKIWQCRENLLQGEQGKKLKDVCLSMALSKMLNRRFAGFMLSETKPDIERQKTKDFVFRGLLVDGEKPHQRAFRIIEEELVFVHDIYYTRYSYLYQKGRYLALSFPVVMIGLYSWLVFLSLHDDSKCNRNPNDESKVFCQHSLKYTTVFIIVVLAFLEAYQLYQYIASGWFKVALIWSYVSRPFLQRNGCYLEMMIGLVLRFRSFRGWKNKLGQYCILRNIDHKSSARNCIHYATLRLMERKRAKKWCGNSVKLSENLKEAIVHSLRRSNGCLKNGITSLTHHGVHEHLSWACDNGPDGSVTRTILIWHIATTLCEHQLDANLRNEDDVVTASNLSQYCLHLLAFAPHLLPDHISVSEPLLDQSIEKAYRTITKAKAHTMEERCQALMKVNHDDDDGLLVAKGAWLANRLIEQERLLRWKVLKDFWAEMMLYVSPSDDARAHLQTLAKGGEFITHLWVLLTHAGVLERGSTEPRVVV